MTVQMRAHQFSTDIERFLDGAPIVARPPSTISETLSLPSSSRGYAFQARNYYLATMGRNEELRSIWNQIYEDRSAQLGVLAAQLFVDDKMEGLQELLFETEGNELYVDLLKSYYWAETSDNRIKMATEMYNKSFRTIEDVTDVNMLAIYTFLLLGKADQGREEVARLLQKKSVMRS